MISSYNYYYLINYNLVLRITDFIYKEIKLRKIHELGLNFDCIGWNKCERIQKKKNLKSLIKPFKSMATPEWFEHSSSGGNPDVLGH